MAVAGGVGGFLGWIATMASVSGTGGHYRVWTFWSILLVVLSGVGLIGGIILWAIFHAPRMVIHIHPGGILNVSGGEPTVAVSGPAKPQPPITATGITVSFDEPYFGGAPNQPPLFGEKQEG